MKKEEKSCNYLIKVGDMFVENMRICPSSGEVVKIYLTNDWKCGIDFHPNEWEDGLSQDLDALKGVYENVRLVKVTETVVTTVEENEVEYDEEDCKFVNKKENEDAVKFFDVLEGHPILRIIKDKDPDSSEDIATKVLRNVFKNL